MKHSVAPQSRKVISLAFFYAVCNVTGIRIALRFGRNTSLLIARAKANLLRRGKNPGGSWASSAQLPLRFDFPASSFSGSRGHRRRSSSGIGVILSLGLQPEGQFACLPFAQVVQEFSWGNDVGYARVSCKGGRVPCVFLHPFDLSVGVARGSCTVCRSP